MRVLERKTYMTDIKPKFDIEKLNLHYGAFHALKDINMQISAPRDHRVHRTVRLRKIDIFKDIEPDERSCGECKDRRKSGA